MWDTGKDTMSASEGSTPTTPSEEETTGPTTEEALHLLEQEVEKLRVIIRHLLPEKSGEPFICGKGGERDINGMFERLWVCPSYGSEAMVVYKRSTYV
jgi:hypothetical protein